MHNQFSIFRKRAKTESRTAGLYESSRQFDRPFQILSNTFIATAIICYQKSSDFETVLVQNMT